MSGVSYEVSALFAIEDEASGVLGLIAETARASAEAIGQARAALAELGNVTLDGARRGIESLAESIGALNRSAQGAAENAERAAAGIGTGAAAAAQQVDELTASINRAADAQERLAGGRSAGGVAPYEYSGEAIPPAGGPRIAPYPQPAMGPIIDHEAEAALLGIGFMSAPGTLGLGYEGERPAAGYGLPMVVPQQPRSYGHRGNSEPYMGGFTNPYTAAGEESGPTINMGGRAHDPSLDIPTPPQGVENELERDRYLPIPPGGGGGGGRGGGGNGGGRNGGVIHFGIAEMAADFAVYDAYKMAAEEENAITRTEIGLQVDPNSAEGKRIAAGLRGTFHQAATGTIYNEAVTSMAGAVYARELGFTAKEGGVEKFETSFPIALRSAEVAEQEHLGSLDESLTASLEYAHMTGHYEPKELTKSLNVLQQISTLTSNSMGAEESILKYSVPIGKAAGIDTDKVAELTGFLQQSGFNSSTAGTGFSHLILGALESGGGINAHLERRRTDAEKELSDALHLTPDEMRKRSQESKGSAHVRAAHDLGLTDDKGHLTFYGADGNLDPMMILQDINRYGQTHKPEETLRTLHDAFGLQGERVAGVLSEPGALDRARRFMGNVDEGAEKFGAQQVQDLLSQTTVQKLEQAWARLADAANNAATPLLGIVGGAAHGVAEGAGSFSDVEASHPFAAGLVGGAATLGTLAATFTVGRGAWRVGRRLAGRLINGGARAAGEAAETAEAGLGVEAAGAAALGGGGLLGALGIPALEFAALKGADYLVGSNVGIQQQVRDEHHTGLGKWIYDNSSAMRWLDNAIHGTGPARSGTLPPAAGAPAAVAAAPGQAPKVEISVGPITLNGVGEDIKGMVDRLFRELAQKLGESLSHSAGLAQGHTNSPFVLGHGH